jgi:hypothetical protein
MPFNVAELAKQARSLPFQMPEFTPAAGSNVPSLKQLSPEAKRLLDAWKPMLERADLENTIVGRPADRKAFEATYRLVMAQMLTNVARTGESQWVREATTAGADVPTYAQQNLAVILKSFPQMFALQLFPVLPLSGPDGRIYFKVTKYDSAYTQSSPNVAVGDVVDDMTKFNKDFTKAAEGAQAKHIKTTMSSMTVSVDSHRLTSEWTYEAEEDIAAVYGINLNSSLINDMSFLLANGVDRNMIDSAIANASSTQSWDATPAASPDYSTLTPSEAKAYDEQIWANGILPLITKIQRKRNFSTTPDWFVVGTSLAERIQKLSTFVGVPNDAGNALTLSVGGLRDIGTIRPLNIRVIVDVQMNTEKGLLGYKPRGTFDPAISLLMYRPVRVTGKVESPGTGEYEQGVYSRYGIGDPDTGQNALSSQLGDAYGVLTVTP